MQTGVSGTQLWYDSEKRANGPSRSVRHPLGDGPVKLRKGASEKKFKPPNHCAEHPLGDAPVNLTKNKINKKTVSH